jgi:environmental stress-induced protein Ves
LLFSSRDARFFLARQYCNYRQQRRILVFPGVDRVITLLEGGEVTLDAGQAFCHTLKHHQPFSFTGDLPVKALLSDGQMSMDFNVMTRRDRCKAKVRVADRTFTTFASRGGVAFVLSGAWQLGDKLLTADQGASWDDGTHTLRLLESEGTLLFGEIIWLAGH